LIYIPGGGHFKHGTQKCLGIYTYHTYTIMTWLFLGKQKKKNECKLNSRFKLKTLYLR